jgi:hypothetical protein
VKEFIDNKADDFFNLEVQYPNGQKPQLVMLDEADNELEVVSVAGWNSESIGDYIKENIKEQ